MVQFVHMNIDHHRASIWDHVGFGTSTDEDFLGPNGWVLGSRSWKSNRLGLELLWCAKQNCSLKVQLGTELTADFFKNIEAQKSGIFM